MREPWISDTNINFIVSPPPYCKGGSAECQPRGIDNPPLNLDGNLVPIPEKNPFLFG